MSYALRVIGRQVGYEGWCTRAVQAQRAMRGNARPSTRRGGRAAGYATGENVTLLRHAAVRTVRRAMEPRQRARRKDYRRRHVAAMRQWCRTMPVPRRASAGAAGERNACPGGEGEDTYGRGASGGRARGGASAVVVQWYSGMKAGSMPVWQVSGGRKANGVAGCGAPVCRRRMRERQRRQQNIYGRAQQC